ncbi:MAG: type II secretion system GspH family protein [Nitrospira sp.]|nr:type II secretion system GspH family protein [Nitrospira sp.]
MRNRLGRNTDRAGFTLIELMIVIGIIALLVSVLAVAIVTQMGKSKPKATASLLQQAGSAIETMTPRPNLKQFRIHAGVLAGDISDDEKIASSQLLAFYLCPARDVWEQAAYYSSREVYEPMINQDQWTANLVNEGQLPYLVDAWSQEIHYYYDRTRKTFFIQSKGEDGEWNTDDDQLYDPRRSRVELYSEIK